MTLPCDGSAPKAEVKLQDFIGQWRDSMGHQVQVTWARQGNRGGELDVQLVKPDSDRDPIRLNVKALGEGKFQCGHFELQDESNDKKIVWSDQNRKGKTSVWERTSYEVPERSRSRSRNRHQVQAGDGLLARLSHTVNMRRMANGYRWQYAPNGLPYLTPRPLPPTTWQGARPEIPPVSVLRDLTTPGAWAPPSHPVAPESNVSPAPPSDIADQIAANTDALEVNCKDAKADQLLEAASQAYDQRLANTAGA